MTNVPIMPILKSKIKGYIDPSVINHLKIAGITPKQNFYSFLWPQSLVRISGLLLAQFGSFSQSRNNHRPIFRFKLVFIIQCAFFLSNSAFIYTRIT